MPTNKSLHLLIGFHLLVINVLRLPTASPGELTELT